MKSAVKRLHAVGILYRRDVLRSAFTSKFEVFLEIRPG